MENVINEMDDQNEVDQYIQGKLIIDRMKIHKNAVENVQKISEYPLTNVQFDLECFKKFTNLFLIFIEANGNKSIILSTIRL